MATTLGVTERSRLLRGSEDFGVSVNEVRDVNTIFRTLGSRVELGDEASEEEVGVVSMCGVWNGVAAEAAAGGGVCGGADGVCGGAGGVTTLGGMGGLFGISMEGILICRRICGSSA